MISEDARTEEMKKTIYLDNGATTKVDPKVVEEMLPYFTEFYGNPSSIYSFSEKPEEAVGKARTIIAKRINADPKEIIFTSGGSETDNLALRGAAYAAKKHKNKSHIITSNIEHPAILNTCKALENQGFRVTYLDVDNKGFIDIKKLESAITENTFLVSIMHANNEIGTIQDIQAIGELCKSKGILFHTDAAQSFTKTDIDVKKMDIDLMSLASHKIHGPKGVGALYLKKGVDIINLITGGHQERDIRAGTENVPGIAGFGKAVELATPAHIDKMKILRAKLIKGIEDNISNTKLNGPKGDSRLCNNVNFAFRYVEGEGILLHLDEKGICVSTGSACSSKSLKPSHVLIAISLPADVAHGCIRFTLSRFTTEEEIEHTIKCVREVIEELRKMSPLTPKEDI